MTKLKIYVTVHPSNHRNFLQIYFKYLKNLHCVVLCLPWYIDVFYYSYRAIILETLHTEIQYNTIQWTPWHFVIIGKFGKWLNSFKPLVSLENFNQRISRNVAMSVEHFIHYLIFGPHKTFYFKFKYYQRHFNYKAFGAVLWISTWNTVIGSQKGYWTHAPLTWVRNTKTMKIWQRQDVKLRNV